VFISDFMGESMKNQIGLALVLALTSVPAFANQDVQGPDIQALNPGDYPSVCLIQVYQPSTKMGYLCTGSVISSNSILTAGHCVLDDDAQIETAQLSMLCGSKLIKAYPYKNLKVTKPEEKYWVTQDGEKSPTFSKDLAVIQFSDQTFQSTPLPVAFDGQKYFGKKNAGQIKSGVDCLLIGYGRSGTEAGKLYSSPAKDVLHYAPAFDETPMVVMISAQDGAIVRDSIDHGDSGGPLLCRKGSGSYEIVGINESGDGGLDAYTGAHFNAFTPVFNDYSSSLIQQGIQ